MRYVEKVRLLDYWGIQDSALSSEFRRSHFLLMVDRKPLVKKDGNNISLSVHGHSELHRNLGDYGLSFDTSNSCLLDVVDGSDNDMLLPFYVPLFGASLKAVEPSEDAPVQKDDVLRALGNSLDGRFIDLRMAMLTMASDKERNLLAKFQSLSRWYRTFRRCPKCGAPLRLRLSKSAAHCSSCSRTFYPTFSPVAITLVTDPTDSFALLIRHKASPPGVYTAIAGFALPGESLEECARREVAEEVGIVVDQIQSLNRSQPWPMPDSSLMCAHRAVADMSQKIDCCPAELESARWFSREHVAEALQRTLKDPFLKGLPKDVNDRQKLMYIVPQGAVAHHMIKEWVQRCR
ncbi:hypothetical protein Q1695_006233 [Nippostrongylus brasiliensis]|nr:hypothetical protein Q1695_006233 [Nippostrongylus brasiliensis]